VPPADHLAAAVRVLRFVGARGVGLSKNTTTLARRRGAPMKSATRHAYLDALGLESWVLRPAATRAGAPPPATRAGWEELRRRVAACTRCALCATRTQTVFGVGNPEAEWLIVGEAPGAEEDRQGEPF